MFLTRANQIGKSFVISFLAHEGVEAFLNLFEGDAYAIVFSYQEESERLRYEAYSRKLDPKEPYIQIEIMANGLPFEENHEPLSIPQMAFYVYLFNLENELFQNDPEALKRIYAKDWLTLSHVEALNDDELMERAQARSDFMRYFLTDDFSDTSLVPSEKQWDLSLRITSDLFDRHHLSLELWDGNEKKIPITSLALFLERYGDEGTYEYRLKKYSLAHSLFQEPAKKVLAYLSNLLLGLPEYPTKEILLTTEQLSQILELYMGENIVYQGDNYYITKELKKAGFRYEENGDITFIPSLSLMKKSRYLSSKKEIILFDDLSGIITLYHFANSQSKKLMAFFLKHGDKDYAFVKDLVLKKVPYSLSLNEQNTTDDRLKITLYVDISEAGSLLFRSEYELFGHVVNKQDVMPNPIYGNAIQLYLSVLESLGGVERGIQEDQSKVLNFLQADLSLLKKRATLMLSEKLNKVKISHVSGLSLNLAHNGDWLSVSVKSNKFSLKQLETILSAYRKKKKFVLLSDNIILLSDPIVEELNRLKQKEKLDDKFEKHHLPFSEALRLQMQQENGILPFDTDDYFRNAFRQIASFAEQEVEIKPSLLKVLRPYQIHAIQWLATLHQNHLGGILADDMGLGKTLETISFLSTLKTSKPSLIIAPKSVLYNWEKEFHAWDPSLAVQVIDGNKERRNALVRSIDNKTPSFYITSYDSLRNDIALYKNKTFEVMITDEAQLIKNFSALKSKAVRDIHSISRFALTGTPIENSLTDLWSIFDFLMPGYLDSFNLFKQRYILAGNQVEARASLRKRITPFLLRRTKKEVLKELPKKSEEIVALTMDDEARMVYQANIEKAKNELNKAHDKTIMERDRFSSFNILPVLTMLREICVDPSVFIDGFEEISSKLLYVIDYAKSAILSGHKLLIFSSFARVLEHLGKLLKEEGIPSYYIHGETPAKKRLELASHFNAEDEVSIMLVSLKAGGTGLNLAGADVVIHLDPWWNLAAEEQATDRAYRIGQKRPVTVLKLICHDSIEERVLELQDLKKALYNDVIFSGERAISSLSEEDLNFLLS